MHYLHTSALVKLLFAESESAALDRFVAEQDVAVSALSRVELRRLALRIDPTHLDACHDLLESCFEIALTPHVLDRAGTLRPSALRSLDAIHLASAGVIGDELGAFVAYDSRLLSAAREASMNAVSPS